jgi:hypothetical protein
MYIVLYVFDSPVSVQLYIRVRTMTSGHRSFPSQKDSSFKKEYPWTSANITTLTSKNMLRYCMFYGFLRVSRDLEINRLKVRELFVRRHVRLI